MKQTLNSDDVAGIQSVWGAPQYDQFNSNGQSNGMFTRAANINSYIDANGQIAIPSLDITTGSQVEWFSVTVPSSTNGTLVATVQSTNLSSLSPKVSVYTTGLSLLGSASSSSLGATVSVSLSGVRTGQTYLVRANGNTAGLATGGFGLELNFGSVYQPPIAPPNTVVPQQPDQGGGGANTYVQIVKSGGGANTYVQIVKIGNLTALGNVLSGSPRGYGAGVTGVPQGSSKQAAQLSLDPSPATNGLAALVAGTNTGQPQLFGGVSPEVTGSQTPSSLDSGSNPSTLQAVDFLIMNWNYQDRLLAFTGWNAPNGSLLSS